MEASFVWSEQRARKKSARSWFCEFVDVPRSYKTKKAFIRFRGFDLTINKQATAFTARTQSGQRQWRNDNGWLHLESNWRLQSNHWLVTWNFDWRAFFPSASLIWPRRRLFKFISSFLRKISIILFHKQVSQLPLHISLCLKRKDAALPQPAFNEPPEVVFVPKRRLF